MIEKLNNSKRISGTLPPTVTFTVPIGLFCSIFNFCAYSVEVEFLDSLQKTETFQISLEG